MSKNPFVKELYKNLVEITRFKEKIQNNYLSSIVLQNIRTGQVYNLNFNYKDYINKYFNYLIQKVMYLQYKNKDTLPIFLTFTLPTEYHYFSNHKNIFNKDFKFGFNLEGIKESIMEGSKELYKLFRNFYLSLKNDRDTKEYFKNLDYFGILEYHKTFTPHSHFLLFIPLIDSDRKKTYKIIKRKWENFLRRNNLNKKTNKLLKLKGEKGGSLYVSKYLQKTLKNLKNDNLYFFTGWKSLLNRLFYSSRVGLTKEQFLKIYYNLPISLKEKIMEKVKVNNSCLMYEIEKLTTIKTIKKIFKDNKKEKTEVEKKGNINKSYFYIIQKYKYNKSFNFVEFLENLPFIITGIRQRIEFMDFYFIYLDKFKDFFKNLKKRYNEDYYIFKRLFDYITNFLIKNFNTYKFDILKDKTIPYKYRVEEVGEVEKFLRQFIKTNLNIKKFYDKVFVEFMETERTLKTFKLFIRQDNTEKLKKYYDNKDNVRIFLTELYE